MSSRRGGPQPGVQRRLGRGTQGGRELQWATELWADGGWLLLLLPQIVVWDPQLRVPTAASWVTLCEEVTPRMQADWQLSLPPSLAGCHLPRPNICSWEGSVETRPDLGAEEQRPPHSEEPQPPAAPSLGEQGPGPPSPEVTPAVILSGGLRGHEGLSGAAALSDGRRQASRQHAPPHPHGAVCPGQTFHTEDTSCAFEEPFRSPGGSAPGTTGLCVAVACACVGSHQAERWPLACRLLSVLDPCRQGPEQVCEEGGARGGRSPPSAKIPRPSPL